MIADLCEECGRRTTGRALCDECIGIPASQLSPPVMYPPQPVHRPIVECVVCRDPFRSGDSPLPDTCPACAAAAGLLVEGVQ